MEYQTVSIPRPLMKKLRQKLGSSFSSDSERVKYLIRIFLKQGNLNKKEENK